MGVVSPVVASPILTSSVALFYMSMLFEAGGPGVDSSEPNGSRRVPHVVACYDLARPVSGPDITDCG
eukprot:10837783-Alexandrium_andersonii.AAC.1